MVKNVIDQNGLAILNKKMIEMTKYDCSKWLKWLKQLVEMTILILKFKI